MAISQIVIARHGQSIWNLENKFTGWEDVGLTDQGKQEAEELGQAVEQMQRGGGSRYLTSDLLRAQDTIKIAMRTIGYSDEAIERLLEIDERMKERSYAGLTGLNKAETVEKFGQEQVDIWRRAYDADLPEHETGPEKYPNETLRSLVEGRVGEYYREVLQPMFEKGENALASWHGNSIRALLINLDIATPENINNFEIANGKPYFLKVENGVVKEHNFEEKVKDQPKVSTGQDQTPHRPIRGNKTLEYPAFGL